MTWGEIRTALKRPRQLILKAFQERAFFFQSQMDIHPRSRWFNRTFAGETGGFYPRVQDSVQRRIINLEAFDNTRRDQFVLLLKQICDRNVPGAMAEVGVYQGRTAKLFHHYMPDRRLYLFDTFSGFGEKSVGAERTHTGANVRAEQFADTSVEAVRAYVEPRNDNVILVPGLFPQSVTDEMKSSRFAFVHLDADLYEPILEGLKFFYPRMSPKGMIVVHDFNAWIGARKAVEEFMADKPDALIPLADKSGSAVIVKI